MKIFYAVLMKVSLKCQPEPQAAALADRSPLESPILWLLPRPPPGHHEEKAPAVGVVTMAHRILNPVAWAPFATVQVSAKCA